MTDFVIDGDRGDEGTPITEMPKHDTRADVPVPEGFHVHDESTANWVVRKVVQARAYGQHVEQWAASEMRRAQAEEELLLQRFGPELEQWTRTQLAKRGGRIKSVRLPAGAIGFRQLPGRVCVCEPALTWGWCRQHLPQALRLEVSADGEAAVRLQTLLEAHVHGADLQQHVLKSLLQQHVVRTGECPEGADISRPEERFFSK